MWEAGLLFCRCWECQHLSTQSFYCPSSLVYYLCVAILTNKLLHRTVKQSEWDMKVIIVFAFLLINQNMYVCVCFMPATCSLSYQHRPIRNSLRVEHWFCVCLQEEQASVWSVVAAFAAAGDAQDLRPQSSLHQHEPQLDPAQSGHAHTLLTHSAHTKHLVIYMHWCSLSL